MRRGKYDSSRCRGCNRSQESTWGAGIKVRGERPVLLTTVVDRPSELGKIARKIASAGVNIELFYLAASGQLVIGVDNLEKAQAALSQ